jgi:hypothetical protein
MKLNEYEERFQRPAPSWRQILAANQTRNRIHLRKLRYLLAAALVALITLTMELASSHRTAHSHGSSGSAAGPGFHLLPAEFRRILDLFGAAEQGVVVPRRGLKDSLARGDR